MLLKLKALSEADRDLHLQYWLRSENGRLSLEILRDRIYDVPSFHENPLEMARIAGQREVIEEFIALAKGE